MRDVRSLDAKNSNFKNEYIKDDQKSIKTWSIESVTLI